MSPSDAGQYTIIAINEDGEARSEAPVTSKSLILKYYFNFIFDQHIT